MRSGLPTLSIAAMVMALLAQPAIAQDIRAIKTEQDLLELQNQVRVLQRRIEALEAQHGSRPPGPGQPGNSTTATSDPNARWLDEASWERIRPGMSELQVVRILGVPNALRRSPDNERQTLMYALEIGSGGFLSGAVIISNRKVVEVQKPALK